MKNDEDRRAVHNASNDRSWQIFTPSELCPSGILSTTLPDSDISHIFFTSGSSGRPKGCIGTYRNLLAYCRAKIDHHHVTAASTVFAASAHTFDPLLGDVMSSLMAGATLALAPRTRIFALHTCLQVSHATHVLTTPSTFASVIESETTLPDLRVIALGGEPLPHKIVAWCRKMVPNARLATTYGVTECCVYQAIAFDGAPGFPTLVGHAMGSTKLYLSNESGGSVEHEGEMGEVCIAGEMVGLGYLHREELTQTRFFSHPTYGRTFRTGDIAVVQKSDTWRLVGRRDGMVKIRGQRVELGEIEHVIAKDTELVKEVAVIVAGALVANVVLVEVSMVPQEMALVRSVLSFLCALRVPRHMVPRFRLVSEMPLTSSGKVSRRELVALERARNPYEESWSEPVALTTDGERLVARVWSEELFGKPTLIQDAHADFNELSGDSLAALRICKRLADEIRLGISSDGGVFGENLGPLGPAELLKRPRLCDFAQYIEKYRVEPSLVELPPQEASTKLYDLCLSAVRFGNVAVVQVLLRSGMEINGLSVRPLHLACTLKQEQIARLLLEKKASVDPSDVICVAQKSSVELMKTMTDVSI